MRKIIALLLIVGLVTVISAAQRLEVKADKTTIFKSKGGSASKGTLSQGESLWLIKKGKNRSLVKTFSGVKGWVINSNTEYVKGNSKGDTYHLDNQDISGWLDNPSAIYILDNSGLNNNALPLSRSFSDEIFEFEDKEQLERGNDEN